MDSKEKSININIPIVFKFKNEAAKFKFCKKLSKSESELKLDLINLIKTSLHTDTLYDYYCDADIPGEDSFSDELDKIFNNNNMDMVDLESVFLGKSDNSIAIKEGITLEELIPNINKNLSTNSSNKTLNSKFSNVKINLL